MHFYANGESMKCYQYIENGGFNMKLIPSNSSFLFASTEISDIFFTEYLPEAKSEFVKVYFYVLFLKLV